MSFNTAITGFSRGLSYAMPTVTQAAVIGTVTQIIYTAIVEINENETSIFLNFISLKMRYVLASTTALTLSAAFQKTRPLLSRLIILLPVFLLAKECISKKKADGTDPIIGILSFIAILTNVIATGALLHQQRSLPRVIHFIGSLTVPLYVVYKGKNGS